MPRVVLDTNIVIRLLVGEPEDQAKRCRELLTGEQVYYIPGLVVAEAVWATRSFYGIDKADLVAGLQVLLQDPHIETEPAVMEKTLELFGTKNIDFVDAYLAARSILLGDELVTFDVGLKKTSGVKLYSGL